MDVDSGWCVETCDTSHAQFRKGLMKDLKRPYDEKEYKRLFKQLNRRRSVSGKLRASYRKQHIGLFSLKCICFPLRATDHFSSSFFGYI